MIEDYLLRHNPFTFVLRQAKCSQIAASCTSWGEKGGGGPSGFLAPFNGTKGLIR